MEKEHSSKNNDLQIRLHSQEVDEILSYIPHWIIRWGITLILGTVLLILIGTWFIKYPEIIPAEVTITSQNPPQEVSVRSSGNINLLVENGSLVRKGNELGYVESSSNFNDIIKLNKYIANYEELNKPLDRINGNEEFQELDNLRLGELQSTFESFYQYVQSLRQFEKIDFHHFKIDQISKRIRDYQQLNQSLKTQKNIAQEEYEISAQKLSRDSLLYRTKAISEEDIENSRLIFLQNNQSIENAAISILNNQLRINELKSQIAELNLEYQQEHQNLIRSLSKSLELLKSDIASWEKKYVLTAPLTGNVTFFEIWSDGQYVNTGDVILSVVPEKKELFGLLKLPIARSGKVKEGQKINIRLLNFPYQQYGMLIGRVERLSMVPKENTYLVYVSLPNGLETTYGNTLEFRQKMQGSAEIITEDLRLLERIVFQLRKVFT